MDDDAKELAKIAAGELFRPATQIIDDVFGILGADALRAFRERQQERRRQRHARVSSDAIKLLESRGVKDLVEPNADAVDELASAAESEPREELCQLWAKLLAAMFDPSRASSFRREFIAIAKQLEPIDAATLPILAMVEGLSPSRRDFAARQLNVGSDEIEVAFRNLIRLELAIANVPGRQSDQLQPFVTALGRRFLTAVS